LRDCTRPKSGDKRSHTRFIPHEDVPVAGTINRYRHPLPLLISNPRNGVAASRRCGLRCVRVGSRTAFCGIGRGSRAVTSAPTLASYCMVVYQSREPSTEIITRCRYWFPLHIRYTPTSDHRRGARGVRRGQWTAPRRTRDRGSAGRATRYTPTVMVSRFGSDLAFILLECTRRFGLMIVYIQ
jgi:hypothetical protein